jgi:hypothetical protein
MTHNNIPFNFIFDYLLPLQVTVKPMFGMYAVYAGEKILLMLRQQKNNVETNGVWIATSVEHHQSLRKDLPSLCSIAINEKRSFDTEWQMLPEGANDFETSVIKLCELIVHKDLRIGRLPKSKFKKR